MFFANDYYSTHRVVLLYIQLPVEIFIALLSWVSGRPSLPKCALPRALVVARVPSISVSQSQHRLPNGCTCVPLERQPKFFLGGDHRVGSNAHRLAKAGKDGEWVVPEKARRKVMVMTSSAASTASTVGESGEGTRYGAAVIVNSEYFCCRGNLPIFVSQVVPNPE